MLTGLIVVATGVLLFGQDRQTVSDQAGSLLWAVIGALIFYIYTMLDLPGSHALHNLGNWAGLLTTLLGGLAGWLLYRATKSFRISHN